MTRRDLLRSKLDRLAEHGVIAPTYQIVGQRPGVRWLIVPTGYSERSMSTLEAEYFALGALSALDVVADVAATYRRALERIAGTETRLPSTMKHLATQAITPDPRTPR